MWPSLGFTCTSRSDPIGIIHIAREETMNIAEVVCLWFNSHLNKKDHTLIRTSFYKKGRKAAVYACFRKFGRVHLHLMNELISVLPKMLFKGPPNRRA